jgi:hypothetical protein
MIRLIAVAGFAFAVATSAQAMTPAPIPQPDSLITQVAYGCGPFRTLMVASAWPEPPFARRGARFADVFDGPEPLALHGGIIDAAYGPNSNSRPYVNFPHTGTAARNTKRLP